MRLKMTLQLDPHNLKVIRFFLKERIGHIIQLYISKVVILRSKYFKKFFVHAKKDIVEFGVNYNGIRRQNIAYT